MPRTAAAAAAPWSGSHTTRGRLSPAGPGRAEPPPCPASDRHREAPHRYGAARGAKPARQRRYRRRGGGRHLRYSPWRPRPWDGYGPAVAMENEASRAPSPRSDWRRLGHVTLSRGRWRPFPWQRPLRPLRMRNDPFSPLAPRSAQRPVRAERARAGVWGSLVGFVGCRLSPSPSPGRPADPQGLPPGGAGRAVLLGLGLWPRRDGPASLGSSFIPMETEAGASRWEAV